MRLEMLPRTELALRIVSILGDGGRWRAVDLADLLDISPDSVAQLMMPLTRAGWVRSRPGPRGGHELARELVDISVLDLIEAVEGIPESGRCVMADRPCPAPEPCAMHDAWVPARDQMLRHLGATSLQNAVPRTTPLRTTPLTNVSKEATP